jgi:uncharacterized protein with PhoU and TrkA domain
VGRSLRELALPRRRGISVVLVHDVILGRVLAVPDPNSVLKESDTLLVAGSDETWPRRRASDARKTPVRERPPRHAGRDSIRSAQCAQQ